MPFEEHDRLGDLEEHIQILLLFVLGLRYGNILVILLIAIVLIWGSKQ